MNLWPGSLVAIVVLLVACGCTGGGSGSPSASASSGRVALLIADGPAEEHEQVFARIGSVVLCSTSGSTTVLYENRDGAELDLLRLREQDYFLSMTHTVPVGVYDCIRVFFEEIRAEGGPCHSVSLSHDWVEVRPQVPLQISANSLRSIRLDIDVDKSLRVATSGSSAPCIFDPVVFLTVEPGPPQERCFRCVEGVIQALEVGMNGSTTGFTLDLGDGRGDLTVDVSGAGVFDQDALPATVDIFQVGQEVTIRGDLSDAADLIARAVVVGVALEIRGEIESVTSTSLFYLNPAPGQGVVGLTSVEVSSQTFLLFGCEDADVTDIVVGLEVEVLGKLVPSAGVFRSVALVLDAPGIAGVLLSVASSANGYDVEVLEDGETNPISVFVPDSVGFRLFGDGPIAPSLLQGLVLCQPRRVQIALDPGDLGTALEVVVEAVERTGVLEQIDLDNREIVLEGELIAVEVGATLLDLEQGQQLIELSDLVLGDLLRVFGLDTCPGDGAGALAFVVLRLPQEAPPQDDPGQGCGPGYWKQSHHFDDWASPYDPSTLFEDVFDNAFPGLTLVEVLSQGGGSINALGRHTVAALLNAASAEVDFGWNASEVVDAFDDAYPNGDFEALKDDFEDLNERECPLGN